MKTGQMILVLLLLAGIVFGVTFVTMFSEGQPLEEITTGDPQESTPSAARDVVFAQTQFPPTILGVIPPPIESERMRIDHRDFWFENREDKPVRMGAFEKGCKCSEIKLFIAPETWREELSEIGAGPTTKPGRGLMPSVLGLLAQEKREELGRRAEKEAKGATLEVGDLTGVEVPARASGFVRLLWDGSKLKTPPDTAAYPSRQVAAIWLDSPESGDLRKLEVHTLFMPPVRIDIEGGLSVGKLTRNEKQTAFVRVWSSTRDNFELKFKVEDEPLIQVGELLPLTEQDMKELEEVHKGKVVFGYRVPITVRERSEDDKNRFILGPFKRSVKVMPELTSEPKSEIPPYTLEVRGEIEGDFDILSNPINGRINLGAFQASNGAQAVALITTSLTDVKLELEGKPDFAQVTLKPSEDSRPNRLRWDLNVVVPKGTKERGDLSAGQDNAIYLKVQGGGNDRRIRIPINGDVRVE